MHFIYGSFYHKCSMFYFDFANGSQHLKVDNNQMIQQQAYDAFGFRTTKLTLAVEASLHDPEQDQKDLARWKKLLPHLSNYKLKDEKKLLEEVQKGIPNQIRPKVWAYLITPPLKQYGQVVITEYLREIDRDIDRTIPTNKHDKQVQIKLREVLNKLAYAFPQMGYCQGLNFIAGNLLLILSPEQTYNTMFHILYWQRHQLLMSDMGYIHEKIFCLDKLIRKHFPKLYNKLEQLQIDTILFACSWFVTLFNNVFPCQFSFKILELYFLQGEKIIYKACLQILREKKRIVKGMHNKEQIIAELKNYEDFNKTMEKRFFNEMSLLRVTNKQIEEYQNQYHRLAHI